jgi:membrane protein implicated in regulation of membrane protease activity
MDPLEAVFVFCFVFGAATSVLSFVLGSLHGPDGGHGALGGHGGAAGHGLSGGHHIGLHADLGVGHGDHGGHAHAVEADGGARSGGVSPFNLQTITVFLACFGGAGWVLYDSLGVAPAVALIVGALAGLAGSAVVFWFLVKVLLAGQSFLDPTDSRMEGMVGRVTQAISASGTGEIVFSRDGGRHSSGARSATGEPIPVGTEVVIVRYEQGMAEVEPWASFTQEQ